LIGSFRDQTFRHALTTRYRARNGQHGGMRSGRAVRDLSRADNEAQFHSCYHGRSCWHCPTGPGLWIPPFPQKELHGPGGDYFRVNRGQVTGLQQIPWHRDSRKQIAPIPNASLYVRERFALDMIIEANGHFARRIRSLQAGQRFCRGFKVRAYTCRSVRVVLVDLGFPLNCA